MNPAIPFALLALASAISLWRGRRSLRAEYAERTFWRDVATRELMVRGPDVGHWL